MFKKLKWLLIAPVAVFAAEIHHPSGGVAQTPADRAASEPSRTPSPSDIVSQTSLSAPAPVPDANSLLARPTVGMERVPSVSQLGTTGAPAAPTSQVTSVSQLGDVRPTDWAFQALQSLVERYGCIAGYPDRTYRGNRALTRYEFAAGLNACLDRVNELIAAATSDLVKKEDLATLQKLQEQFVAELATLRGRLETLEARTATLQRQQFSATTKLTGNVWFNATTAFPTGDITTERNPANPGSAFAPNGRDPVTNVPRRVVRRDVPSTTFSYYTFLNFTSSFTGKDSLIVQLVSGNGNSPANELVSTGFYNSWGVPITDQTGVVERGTVAVRELAYIFPIGESVRVAVGPRLNWYRFFDANRFTFFLTGANSFNSSGSTLLNAVDRGSGAAIIWTINPELRFTVAYVGENTEFLNSAAGFNTSSSATDGLFRPSNTISAELGYAPTKNFNLRLHYTRSNLKAYNGFIGGTVGEPLPYGYADDGFGGTVNNATADAFMVNFDWLISSGFGIFGRYSYGKTNIDPVSPTRSGGSVNVQSIQFGLGFPDLGKKGALGVVSFLVPHDYLSGRRFLQSGGGNGGTQYEVEASYFYPINNNLAIVPSIYAIFNPNNFSSNPAVIVGNLRTQFSF